MRRAAVLLMSVAAVAAIAGCGSSGKPKASATASPPPEATATTTPPEAAPGAPKIRGAGPNVARRWADAVRAGDFHAAAALFAVPAKVANGGKPLLLSSRGEIDFFNRTLPCGARLTRTHSAGNGRFVAIFQLTDRSGPGANCGSGIGNPAAVRFLVRKGRIVEWLRVATPSAGGSGQET